MFLNTVLLLLLAFIYISTGFIRISKPNIIIKKCFMKTCFYDDEEKHDRLNKKMKNMFDIADFEPIYTLIWYDCKKCRELLEIIKNENLNKKIFYINGGYYFYDLKSPEENNKPLLYKDDEFITDELFEIYEELFPM